MTSPGELVRANCTMFPREVGRMKTGGLNVSVHCCHVNTTSHSWILEEWSRAVCVATRTDFCSNSCLYEETTAQHIPPSA